MVCSPSSAPTVFRFFRDRSRTRTASSRGSWTRTPTRSSSGSPPPWEPTARTAKLRGVEAHPLAKHAMLRCTPFLLFDGNCAEAMAFYHSCLGGELVQTKLGDTPMRAQFPPEKHDRIIN